MQYSPEKSLVLSRGLQKGSNKRAEEFGNKNHEGQRDNKTAEKRCCRRARRNWAKDPTSAGDGLPPASAVRYRAYLSENVLYWKI
jgi:hypothetical protein